MSIVMMALAIPLLAIFIKSDIAQALADAIRHNSGASAGASTRLLGELRAEVEVMRAELDETRGELELVRTELLETQERVDFAERLLAKGREEVGS